MMKKIEANDHQTKSADLIAENVEKLKALFPELVTEGPEGLSVNVDVLKQLVGDRTLTEAEEKYGLSWYGKRCARQLALTPSTGTLRPCPEESENWDTTQNIFIEGDNLEVLKLLQKSYAGKIKLIYIDPPYNTGKDFIYKDDFRDNIRNYKRLTGQVDEEGSPLTTNTETSGRFHTDWLNMMYPRLKLARNLLKEDGIICISIGEEEVFELRLILNEIFGEENHRNTLAIRRYDKNLSQQFMEGGLPSLAVGFEYVLVYSRSGDSLINPVFREASDKRKQKGYWKGFWNAADRPTMRYKLLGVKPETGQWKWSKEKADEAIANYEDYLKHYSDKITLEEYWLMTGRTKKFLRRNLKGKGMNLGVEHWIPPTKDTLRTSNWTDVLASRPLKDLAIPFSNPKSVDLLRLLIHMGTQHDSIILDFFAGSATTAHAVMAKNAKDGGNRRYILVQLPEPLDPGKKEQKTAAEFCDKLSIPRTIAELAKERLRRAAKKIKEEYPDWDGDTGFRVFKLDSSNIKAWNTHPQDLEKSLLDHVEHILPGRTEVDLLYELLLKLGLDLCVPIESREITGCTVHAVGGGVLMACLAEKIMADQIEELGEGIVEWHKILAPVGETTCVFRDSAFENDIVKTNLAAILKQSGIQNVRSL